LIRDKRRKDGDKNEDTRRKNEGRRGIRKERRNKGTKYTKKR
jgi:hypothetical protein